MQNTIKFVASLILAALLCACTPQPSISNYHLSWQTRQQQLTDIKNWQLYGMMSMLSSQQKFTASLAWKQQDTNYAIYLSGPLGIGAVHIFGTPGNFTLQTSQTRQYSAKTPEALMQQQLGWHLPISNLYYWVRGLPVPGVKATKYFDYYNRLIELDQQGWQIKYDQYNDGMISLPGQIILHYPGITVKIAISRWVL